MVTPDKRKKATMQSIGEMFDASSYVKIAL